MKNFPTTRLSKLASCLAAILIARTAPAGEPAHNNTAESPEYAIHLRATRTAYFKVVTGGGTSADEEAHAALSAFEDAFPHDARGLAYHGSLELLDAAHSWQVWNLHKQTNDGLSMLDAAVAQAPDEPEVRFLRAVTDWHLPSFLHRREQCEADFAILASHAEEDARQGSLPPELAAASLSYWGQILLARSEREKARKAFQMAVRIAPESHAAADARERLQRF